MDIKIISKYIYILNLELLKNICDKLKINYYINIELENGKIKQTNEILHKEIIIKLIIKKLKTNQSKKIIYSLNIQNYKNSDDLTKNSYIYYGQYKTTNKNIKKLMKKLTNSLFYFGAISQKIIKKYWKNNKLITYEQFANLWLTEHSLGEIKYEELAYNQFMKKYGDKEKWFELKDKVIKYFKNCNLL